MANVSPFPSRPFTDDFCNRLEIIQGISESLNILSENFKSSESSSNYSLCELRVRYVLLVAIIHLLFIGFSLGLSAQERVCNTNVAYKGALESS